MAAFSEEGGFSADEVSFCALWATARSAQNVNLCVAQAPKVYCTCKRFYVQQIWDRYFLYTCCEVCVYDTLVNIHPPRAKRAQTYFRDFSIIRSQSPATKVCGEFTPTGATPIQNLARLFVVLARSHSQKTDIFSGRREGVTRLSRAMTILFSETLRNLSRGRAHSGT